jgi:hypothetical protein
MFPQSRNSYTPQNSIYIVLYSRYNNPHTRFDCYRPIDSVIDIGVDLLTGPFTHCHIAYGARQMTKNNYDSSGKKVVSTTKVTGVLCTKITAYLGTVCHDLFEDHRVGDCYLQLLLSDTEYNLLLDTVNKLVSSKKTYFSYAEFFGLRNAEFPSETRQGWTCISLTAYLLQRIGVIERDVDISKLNVTALYLLLTPGSIRCKQVEFYPFFLQDLKPGTSVVPRVKTADQVYAEYMGIKDERERGGGGGDKV